MTRINHVPALAVLGAVLFPVVVPCFPPARAAVPETPSALSGEQRAALRTAIPLPQFEVGYGMAFSPRAGFTFLSDEADLKVQAAVELAVRQAAAPEPVGTTLERAEEWLRRARLASDAGLEKDEEVGRATALFRRALKERPLKKGNAASVRAAVGLAAALGFGEKDRVGRGREAVALMRRAVSVAPDDADAWAGLGGALVGDGSWAELFSLGDNEPVPGSIGGDYDALVRVAAARLLAAASVPDGVLARVEARGAEAVRCLDRAVSLAPGRADLYLSRAVCRSHSTAVVSLARVMREVVKQAGDKSSPLSLRKPPPGLNLLDALLSPESLSDVRAAALRSPDDPASLAAVDFVPVLMAGVRRAMEAAQAGETPEDTALLSEEVARKITSSLNAWLARTPQRPSDPAARRNRSRAVEMLGVIAFLRKDNMTAEAHFREAAAIAPDRHGPFDLWMAALTELGREGEMVEPLRERLSREDRPRYRAVLANTLSRLGRDAEAESAITGPVKGAVPEYTGSDDAKERRTLMFSHAAVQLRRCANGSAADAAIYLKAAGALIDRLSAERGRLDKDGRALLDALRGAHLALTGDQTGALAVLAAAPADTDYDDDLSALRAALEGKGAASGD
jgi:hypothetical protein